MTLRQRLKRLEECRGPAVCPGCRQRRGRIVFRTVRERPDGTVVSEEPEPASCPRCGDVPEQVIDVVARAVTACSGTP